MDLYNTEKSNLKHVIDILKEEEGHKHMIPRHGLGREQIMFDYHAKGTRPRTNLLLHNTLKKL